MCCREHGVSIERRKEAEARWTDPYPLGLLTPIISTMALRKARVFDSVPEENEKQIIIDETDPILTNCLRRHLSRISKEKASVHRDPSKRLAIGGNQLLRGSVKRTIHQSSVAMESKSAERLKLVMWAILT